MSDNYKKNVQGGVQDPSQDEDNEASAITETSDQSFSGNDDVRVFSGVKLKEGDIEEVSSQSRLEKKKPAKPFQTIKNTVKAAIILTLGGGVLSGCTKSEVNSIQDHVLGELLKSSAGKSLNLFENIGINHNFLHQEIGKIFDKFHLKEFFEGKKSVEEYGKKLTEMKNLAQASWEQFGEKIGKKLPGLDEIWQKNSPQVSKRMQGVDEASKAFDKIYDFPTGDLSAGQRLNRMWDEIGWLTNKLVGELAFYTAIVLLTTGFVGGGRSWFREKLGLGEIRSEYAEQIWEGIIIIVLTHIHGYLLGFDFLDPGLRKIIAGGIGLTSIGAGILQIEENHRWLGKKVRYSIVGGAAFLYWVNLLHEGLKYY